MIHRKYLFTIVGDFGVGLFWYGGVVRILFWFLGLFLFALRFVRSSGVVVELLQVSVLAFLWSGGWPCLGCGLGVSLFVFPVVFGSCVGFVGSSPLVSQSYFTYKKKKNLFTKFS